MSIATAVLSPPFGGFYRLSVDKFHRMIEAGILEDGERIELLEGYLVPRMTHNPTTAASLDRTRRRIERLLPNGYLARIQLPVTLADSEPEPDVAVARGDDRTYDRRHPGSGDLALVVEVACSSLALDRAEMARIYARAGIAGYWIVNLVDRQVEVHTQPSGPTATPAYAQCKTFAAGASVPVVLDGDTVGHIAVDDLLP